MAVSFAASAQEKVVPEFQALKDQFDAQVKVYVQQSYNAAIVDLNVKYIAALDRALETARQAGKLEEALAIKAEKEEVSLGKGVPATDDENSLSAMRQLRDTYRSAMGRLEVDRMKKLQPLQSAFATSLNALVTALTKEGKFVEATAVKKYRDEVTAAVLAQGPTALGVPAATNQLILRATKESPFVNSLGMKFVPVTDTKVLFCIHETRRQDYAVYATEVPGVDASWKTAQKNDVPIGDKDDHPVVNVSLEDSQKFCDWLSKRENKIYRLPTDREWSSAVGIASDEKITTDTTSDVLSGKLPAEFPYGRNFPPKTKDRGGNYADSSFHEKFSTGPAIEGYSDGFPTTAPVMSFNPNKLGIYDLGGNVWEWCEDTYNPAKVSGVLRGACWANSERDHLLSSDRNRAAPKRRYDGHGFRCVLVVP